MADLLDQIAQDLEAENALGLALAAQLGSTPSELVLMLRTTLIDTATGELKPVGSYAIQMNGLAEHKMTLGPFNQAELTDDHPLLYHHNGPSLRIYITNPATDPDAILSDLQVEYDRLFGQARSLEGDLNQMAGPREVLRQGMGTLGELPKPFADVAARILAEHQVGVNLVEGEPKIGQFRLLRIDVSYFVARLFTVQALEAQSEQDNAD